ncbi:hypothetical protein [Nocardia sp. NBC_00511]|uniref:hypothetical protein n=1 Tax=Nocardia sp. NBC_00511 TaxID=2903591 RepID=UPI0030DE8D85
MRFRSGITGELALWVGVEFTDADRRSLDVAWRLADPAAHKKFEYARLFLVTFTPQPQRAYLELIDGRAGTSLRLPEDLPAGDYAIDVDAYGSASWGDGKLDARGRSVVFGVAAPQGIPVATDL